MMKLALSKAPLFFTIIAFLLMVGCSDDDPIRESTPPEVPNVLVESTLILRKSSVEIKSFIQLSGLNISSDKIVYDIAMYKMIYKTVYKGDTINASSLVFVPQTDDEVSTLSFQHGTVAADSEVPTNLSLNDGQIILNSALAAAGMLTVVPDFIGFGASKEIVHPYYHEFYTATSIVNAIYGAKKIAEDLELNLDTDLYLTGYSQGGYATMATHKYFEEVGIGYFDLKASFPSSGGYDIKGVQDFFFSKDNYDQPFFLAYVAMSYKTSYDFSETMAHFFNAPYAERIPSLFDGSFSGGEINEVLTTNIVDLINPSFLASTPSTPDYKFIYDHFSENSLIDWTPEIRIFMYHGNADVTVPYQNSVDSYDQLIANGASPDVVTFMPLEGGTHFTGVGPWIEEFVKELIILEGK